jgi:hypothetical protein
MNNYLQRLIARAEGVAGAPSLIPNVRREGARQQEQDPFGATLETGESSAAPWPETTISTPSRSKLQPSGEETFAPPAASPSGNRSRLIRRSAPAGEMPAREFDEAPPPAQSDSSRRRPKDDVSPQAVEASTKSSIEPLKIKEARASRVEELKRQNSENNESESQTLRPLNEREPLPMRKTASDAEDEIRLSNKLSQETLERLDRLSEIIESSSRHSNDAANTETLGAAPFNLEPPRAEREQEARLAPPPTDEPRLVIGQLRVDVVPVAQGDNREVVRVVTRDSGQGRSSSVGSQTSKLRFGLGQM